MLHMGACPAEPTKAVNGDATRRKLATGRADTAAESCKSPGRAKPIADLETA